MENAKNSTRQIILDYYQCKTRLLQVYNCLKSNYSDRYLKTLDRSGVGEEQF